MLGPKKLETIVIWQLTRNLRSCGKNHCLVGKSTSWALTRELQFLKFLALPYYFQKYYHTATFTFVLTVSAQHGQSQKTRELMKTAHFFEGYLH